MVASGCSALTLSAAIGVLRDDGDAVSLALGHEAHSVMTRHVLRPSQGQTVSRNSEGREWHRF